MNEGVYRAEARERLVTMLLLMALLHGIVLLGVTFGSDTGGRVSPGMEVLLVTEDQPAVATNAAARYAAQRSQRGAGNTRTGATSLPESRPPSREPVPGEQPPGDSEVLHSSAPQPVIRFAGYAGQQPEIPVLEPPADSVVPTTGRGAGDELVLRGDPRTGQWLSPDTRASELAPYLDGWRRKVERLGTLNYPTVARGTGLSGAPVIEVAILANGQLLEAHVQRSSGQDRLDQAALDILRRATPFSPFPPQLAENYRVLRFAYQWEFVDGRLSTSSVTSATEASGRP
jgi:protein TonB